MADDPSLLFSASASTEADPAATILVCASCRHPGQDDVSPRPGATLADTIRREAAEHGIGFRRTSCLGNCKRGLSAAIMRDGCWTYVFGDLSDANVDDLIAAAKLLAGSQDGLMAYGQRPEALKSRLIARIPSFANLETMPK